MRLAPLPQATPTLDADAISKFVDIVFGYVDDYVPVRSLAETGTPDQKPRSAFHRTEDLAEVLIRLAPAAARERRGLYVVPGTVAVSGSAKANDIVETAVVLVDLDSGDIGKAREHLERHLGPATLVVASGGKTAEGADKLHLYWRLTEAARGDDLERVRAVRELVAVKGGGDDSFKSLHQPIRVAGSVHGKNGVCAPVRIIGHADREFELLDLEDSAKSMPAMPGTKPAAAQAIATRGPTALDLATTKIRAGNQDSVSRYEALSKVIGHWVRNARLRRCSLEGAWDAVSDHNAAMIDPPWPEVRLRREFEALIAVDIRSNGPFDHESDRSDGNESEAVTALSDDAIAAAFVFEATGRFRFVPAWGRWICWSGRQWVHDETGKVKELCRQVCRKISLTARTQPEARRIASDKTMSAVLRIASHDPSLATRSEAWDAHPYLLNTLGGVIDLRTGEMLPHDAGLLLTQMAGASPGTGCPRWLSFLYEVTGGDPELQAYLKRLFGYCLTGDTSEQMFAFLLGNGANGKSVLINTIAAILGDYVATATNETFMASRSDRHLTELAGLRAARLVIVPETEPGRSWAESRIKSVIGGDKIRANFMRQDHFEFAPQFKLLVAGNHRPELSSVGEAMRRRLHLVPFEVTFAPDQRDLHLAAKLLEERDGILGWMLEGCAEWQQDGLSPPERVLRAVSRYFEDEDLVGQWIDECCQRGPALMATSRQLFNSWSNWATETGHTAGNQKSLGSALRARGYESGKIRGHRGWIGISLLGSDRGVDQ